MGSCGIRLPIALVFVVAACSGDNTIRREGRPDVINVAEEDAGMRAAIDSARRSSSDLITRLQKPPQGQTDISVKVRMAEGDAVEHLWIGDVTYDGARLRGVVSNEPVHLNRVKYGDTTSAHPDSISDWMAIENGKLVAGYSVRLLRSRLSAAERAQFDSSVLFVIGP